MSPDREYQNYKNKPNRDLEPDSRTGLHCGSRLPRAGAKGAPQVNLKLVSKWSLVFQPPLLLPVPSGNVPAQGCVSEGQQPLQHRVAPAWFLSSPRRGFIKPVELEGSRELEAEVAPVEIIQEEVTAHAALENCCALATTASPCQRSRWPKQPLRRRWRPWWFGDS